MTRRLVTRSLFIAVGVTCLVESSWGYAVAFGGNDHAAMPVTSSALYQFKPRYYNAALKRFATADPIGLESGLNLYVYGSDNPLAFLDPLGLCADAATTTAILNQWAQNVQIASFSFPAAIVVAIHQHGSRGPADLGFNASSYPQYNYFTPNDIQALKVISSQLAGVIENAHLLLRLRGTDETP